MLLGIKFNQEASMSTNSATIAMKVTPELARKIRLFAARKKMSVSEVCRRIIEKKFESLEKKGKLGGE